VKADDEGVRAVALKDAQTGASRELPVDGVIIFIGFSPNNQLVPAGIRMDHDGCVKTDEKCETSLPGIFVIGDLRRKFAKQIVPAAADGCTAALAAALGVEMEKA
jgi:thioredoxin reductase (NADPH)